MRYRSQAVIAMVSMLLVHSSFSVLLIIDVIYYVKAHDPSKSALITLRFFSSRFKSVRIVLEWEVEFSKAGVIYYFDNLASIILLHEIWTGPDKANLFTPMIVLFGDLKSGSIPKTAQINFDFEAVACTRKGASPESPNG